MENTIKTALGNIFCRKIYSDEYPGMMLGIERNGVEYEFAWLEVVNPQVDDEDEPIMKIHVFGTEDDDPVFDKNIKPEELNKLFGKEVN